VPEAVRSFPILFVDDDANLLHTLRYIVQDRLTVLTAASGYEALDRLAEHDVAVLLADQRMPNMTGIELCARARVLRPGLVTLITTAYVDVTAIAEAMKLGHVTAYIPKPWTADQITDALEFAVGLSAAGHGGDERPTGTFAVRGDHARTRRSSEVVRRSSAGSLLEWGPFQVDILAQRVWVGGTEVHYLEPLQVRVLGCLIERAGVVWRRDELCARLYSAESVNPKALSRAVSALRQRCAEARRLIVSIRAVGYGLGIGMREENPVVAAGRKSVDSGC